MSTIEKVVPHVEREDHELIPPDSPLAPYISVNRSRMHGDPVFAGTRVPVEFLFGHLRGGETIDAFLDGYEGVTREQCAGVIDLASQRLLGGLPRSIQEASMIETLQSGV